MTFRFAAFDLDGTLLGRDRAVDATTVDGLRRLRERGLSLIVVTGRSPYLVGQLGLAPGLLELFEPVMVLRDGDILWDWRTGTIEAIRTIPTRVVPALLARGHADLVVDTGRSLVATTARAAARHSAVYDCPLSAITVRAAPRRVPVCKVTVYGPFDGEVPDGCSIAPGRDNTRYSVVPAGSCKAAGLAGLLSGSYGEPDLAGVIAFGDGSNDACLLAATGAGVAMDVCDPATARAASLRLTGPLAAYLTGGIPDGLAARQPGSCTHRPAG